MLYHRLSQVRRLFNTGDPQLDRRNQREWLRAVRVVRSTRKGWLIDLQPCAKESAHV